MEAISSFLNNMDFTKLVPDLGSVLGWMHTLSILAIWIGPVLMLVFGLMYLFKPTREASDKFGFRTYYGMGSPEAWKFTQRIAGLVWSGLGGVLVVVMGIVSIVFGGRQTVDTVNAAAICLVCQLVLVILAHVGIGCTVARYFDKNGDRRK